MQAHFYPGALAQMQSGLDELLREPNGCFEQASSSNYPNVLILNYMKETKQANPLVEKRARELLNTGYQKLTGYECLDPAQPGGKRGYEALTAYGLLQFRDMAKVYPVESDMVLRTEKYLLDQRDQVGGFKRNPRNLDRFGRAAEHVTNAYIVWALTESGTQANLDVELGALRTQAKNRKEPYFLALVALSHLNRNKKQEGIELLLRVGELQHKEGYVAGDETSITGSQGHDLKVETTSLAVLGWLKERPKDFDANIKGALNWLGQQRRGQGSFGGTQATILALKAMLAYTQKNPKVLQNGEVQMMVRGAPAPVQQPGVNFNNRGPVFNEVEKFELPETNRAVFTARATETLTVQLRDVAPLRPGKNVIELKVTNNAALPYTLTWSYRTLKPTNTPDAPVKLTTSLASEQAKEGETIKLTAVVENASGKGQGMTVAIVGLPGGLALPEDFQQLKDLARRLDDGKKPGRIDAWELRGRELVLYWRELAPDAKIEIELDLICRLPGAYRGPASRAYLYYDADRKHWIEPLGLRILEAK